MTIRLYILALFSLTSFCSLGQEDIPLEQNLQEVRFDKNFDLKYKQALHKIKRVYPLALQAKEYLAEFEKEHKAIEKRRKQKKHGRKSYKILKDQFIYDIRDLYIGEGMMLMKLVHRETNKTVSEIISRYQGQLKSSMYEGMSKIFDQDLGIEYDPYGDDWIAELVIHDIIEGRIPFNWELKPLNKAEFKDTQKEYRQTKRTYRKDQKQAKRKYKKIKRQTKRAGSKS